MNLFRAELYTQSFNTFPLRENSSVTDWHNEVWEQSGPSYLPLSSIHHHPYEGLKLLRIKTRHLLLSLLFKSAQMHTIKSSRSFWSENFSFLLIYFFVILKISDLRDHCTVDFNISKQTSDQKVNQYKLTKVKCKYF